MKYPLPLSRMKLIKITNKKDIFNLFENKTLQDIYFNHDDAGSVLPHQCFHQTNQLNDEMILIFISKVL